MKIIDTIEELVYPPRLYCICCGNIIDENNYYSLCKFCLESVRWNYNSSEEKEGFFVTKAMEYGIFERNIIFGLKYNGKKYIAREVAEILADKLISSNISADLIVPVPMYKAKERARGFNQSKLICKYLGKRLNISVILLRVRNTQSMRSLNKEERKNNIQNSIKLNKNRKNNIENKIIILVDDFVTTGSTVLACKEALLEERPKDVICVAFAGR